jgi:Family of unknown function (DUF5681)
MAFRGPEPGKKTRFKPGQSGNPAGKPKIIIEVVQAARERTVQAIETLETIMLDPKATASARVSAAVSILERGWGKPPATMTLKREGAYRDLSDDELIGLAAGTAEGDTFSNCGADPSATPGDPSKPH